MRKNAKTLLAFGLSTAMVLSSFTTSMVGNMVASAEDATVLDQVLTPDDVTLRVNWDDTSNQGPERIVNIVGGTTDSMTITDNGSMRTDITAKYLAENEMGLGINLGNTMEGGYGPSGMATYGSAKDAEVAWRVASDATDEEKAAAVTTQEYIDEVHSYGINTLRIPVAWSNMISDDGKYTIDDRYLGRVEEIANYALNNGMYVVINDHWDNQWWGQFGACSKDGDGNKVANEEVRAQAWVRYESFWKQISERFKGYSDHLIFEGANEELGTRLNDGICTNGYAAGKDPTEKPVSGNLTTAELYDTANKINQKFVDVVRATGGNNESRFLLIPGYDTDIGKTVDERFIMPEDIAANGTNRLFVSVHYYTPWDFCGDGGTGDYTTADRQATKDYFAKLQRFNDEGYAVIIGECGICNPAGVESSVTQWFDDTFTEAQKYSAVPVLWDTGSYFDRSKPQMIFKDIAEYYNTANGTSGDTSMEKISGGHPAPPDPDNQVPVGKYIDKEVWAKTGIHAYLFYQTKTWDYRNAYTPFRSLENNAHTYEYASASGAELADNAKVIDVNLTENGEYTVSIDSADLSGANAFNMLGVATDLDYKIYKKNQVTLSNVTVKFDGVPVTEEKLTLPVKTDDKYYNFMAVNSYDSKKADPLHDLNENDKLVMPTNSIEITFTVSGLDKPLQDIADLTYINPVTGMTLAEEMGLGATETPSATPEPTSGVATAPAVSATVAPTATETPVDNGAKVGSTFTSGNYKYKVTKSSTVTMTGLTKKGLAAKTLSVATSVKKSGTTYKINAIGSKAFKGAKATTVTLSKKITKIPSSAFANCKKLANLKVKGTLKSVAKNSFKGCKKTIKVSGASKKVTKANVKKLKKSGYKKFK